jgi:proteasome assembly chaperone 3
LPAPPTAIHLTPLLGASPSEHLQTLHALYAAQIATLVWVAEAELVERRSVVVGIALEKVVGEGEEASRVEREVFLGVMGMLREVLNRGV